MRLSPNPKTSDTRNPKHPRRAHVQNFGHAKTSDTRNPKHPRREHVQNFGHANVASAAASQTITEVAPEATAAPAAHPG